MIFHRAKIKSMVYTYGFVTLHEERYMTNMMEDLKRHVDYKNIHTCIHINNQS